MLYAEALQGQGEDGEEGETITARWIRLMEQKNRVPTDEKRRWILATLLGIPAASFGLTPHDPLTRLQGITSALSQGRKPLDLAKYRAFLQSCWTLCHTKMAQSLEDEIAYRVGHLHNEVLYGNAQEYADMMHLLCYYHQLSAQIACDHHNFSDAVESMNKAYRVAKILKSCELQALVLFRRGYVFLENGYTRIAVNDFDAAIALVSFISQPLRGAVQLAAGHGHAYVAQSQEDLTKALKLIDTAHNNMGRGDIDESEHFMKFDEVTYTLDRAEALMGSPVAKLRAPDEAFALISKLKTTPDTPLLQAAIQTWEAKVYMDWGYYPIATTIAINSITNVQHRWNILYISAIHEDLKASKYGNSKEVSNLGIALLKAQQPHLFG